MSSRRVRRARTIEQCFGTYDDAQYQINTLDQTWRPWTFQVCTQWEYFTTAPPDENFPRIVSRLHTLENESKICHQAFPPGEYFTVPPLPNVTSVNILGGFFIAKDRLAIVDGENGVHHWDQNGLRDRDQEQPKIQAIHREVEFIKAWLKGFKRKN